jgi:hypothetical protein
MSDFDFFLDPGLETPVSGPLETRHRSDGGSGRQDIVLYLGNPDAAKRLVAASSPGVDPITAAPTDAAPGSGHEATEIVLALTEAGLDTATPGAAVEIGLQVLGGAANAVPIWIGVTDATGTEGTSAELGVTLNEVDQVDV